jgi:hypothetical protein
MISKYALVSRGRPDAEGRREESGEANIEITAQAKEAISFMDATVHIEKNSFEVVGINCAKRLKSKSWGLQIVSSVRQQPSLLGKFVSNVLVASERRCCSVVMRRSLYKR